MNRCVSSQSFCFGTEGGRQPRHVVEDPAKAELIYHKAFVCGEPGNCQGEPISFQISDLTR
jgi:hypothetical protein